MTKEALKLALEALIGDRAFLESDAPVEIWGVNDKAITALSERLAQPEQEPVAVWELQEDGWDTICNGDWLQTLPVGTKLYTTPPQRKPLTDDEISSLWDGHTVPVFGEIGINPIVFARAIEAAHGIKENT